MLADTHLAKPPLTCKDCLAISSSKSSATSQTSRQSIDSAGWLHRKPCLLVCHPFSRQLRVWIHWICRFTFYVPAINQPMHWGFHSCNGLSVNSDPELWGTPHLWKDVLQRHRQNHIHCMVGGGDQIYNDGFWKMKIFQNWLDTPGNKVALISTQRSQHQPVQAYCAYASSCQPLRAEGQFLGLV